jgi:DNA mismatch repair protein MutS
VVIERAREILRNLEGGELDEQGRPRLAGAASDPGRQLALFAPDPPPRDPREDAALAALRALDPERTTPLEALAQLARLHGLLEQGPT